MATKKDPNSRQRERERAVGGLRRRIAPSQEWAANIRHLMWKILCKFEPQFRKRQFVHIIFVHNFCAPCPPPLPTSKVMDFLLNFCSKGLKQNCEHSAKIANKPSKNCEQTELWTNGRFWNLVKIASHHVMPKVRCCFAPPSGRNRQGRFSQF